MADSRPRGKQTSNRAGSGSSGGRGRPSSGLGGSRRDGGKGPDRGSRGARSGDAGRREKPETGGDADRGRRSTQDEKPRFRIERVEDNAPKAKGSKPSTSKRRKRPAVDVSAVEFGSVAGSTRTKLTDRLGEAANAFSADRFRDSERLLLSINKLAPDVPEVLELLGLSRYRQGKWNKAAADLRRFYEVTASVEQHPVRADCARALEDWTEVERLWKELGSESPEPALIEEGRIVLAGSLADRGRLTDAIRALEKAPAVKGRPGVHHLRRWYTLGDLYDRVGDRSHARRLFSQIVQNDANFGDAAERLASL